MKYCFFCKKRKLITVKRKKELQLAVERIERMEQYFDEIQHAAAQNRNAVFEDETLNRKWKELLQYYEDGQWLKDFERDERGELPAGLKRGVLSEDGVYNLLTEIEEKNGENV